MRLDDACSILGCEKTGTLEDAQKRYRRLALTHHPDRCPDDPGATAKFQTIGEAWSRFQRWKADGFDDPLRDDDWTENATADVRQASWWSSGGFANFFGGGNYAQRCGENCECNFCRVSKMRAERKAKAEAEAQAKHARAAKRWEEDVLRKQEEARKWRQHNTIERENQAEADRERRAWKAEQAARAAAEAAEVAERETAEAAERKRAHEKEAKALRKLRARLRASVEVHPAIIEEERLVMLCTKLDAGALAELCDAIDSALGAEGVGRAVELARAAASSCAEAAQARAQEVAAMASASQPQRPPWTSQEAELMSKAMIKFPGGIADRWAKVAEFVNHLADPCHNRTADEAARRVKDLRKELERQKSEAVHASQRRNLLAQPEPPSQRPSQRPSQQPSQPPPQPPPQSPSQSPSTTPASSECSNAGKAPGLSAPSVPPGQQVPSAQTAVGSTRAPTAATKESDAWTGEQQHNLEAAIKRFPASVGPERWDRIAECVPGKTKADCVRRFKEIAAAIKAKKAAAAAEAAVRGR
jgi:DnaJ family protein C protein 2